MRRILPTLPVLLLVVVMVSLAGLGEAQPALPTPPRQPPRLHGPPDTNMEIQPVVGPEFTTRPWTELAPEMQREVSAGRASVAKWQTELAAEKARNIKPAPATGQVPSAYQTHILKMAELNRNIGAEWQRLRSLEKNQITFELAPVLRTGAVGLVPSATVQEILGDSECIAALNLSDVPPVVVWITGVLTKDMAVGQTTLENQSVIVTGMKSRAGKNFFALRPYDPDAAVTQPASQP